MITQAEANARASEWLRENTQLWYNHTERVLTWEVKSVRYPEEPEHPFGWARRPPSLSFGR